MRDYDTIPVNIKDGPKDSPLPSSKESIPQFSMREFIFRGFGKRQWTRGNLPKNSLERIKPGKSTIDRSPHDPVGELILVSQCFCGQSDSKTHVVRINRDRVS